MNIGKRQRVLRIKMFDLKLISGWQNAPPEEPFYLSKENSTAEGKMIITKGTASSVAHTQMPQEADLGYYSLYSDHQPYQSPDLRRGAGADFKETLSGLSFGMSQVIGREVLFQYHGLTATDVFSIIRPRSISSDEIVIVPIREIPHEYAKREIAEYIQRAGGRKVYISELAEELCLDIELIMEVMEELETETPD